MIFGGWGVNFPDYLSEMHFVLHLAPLNKNHIYFSKYDWRSSKKYNRKLSHISLTLCDWFQITISMKPEFLGTSTSCMLLRFLHFFSIALWSYISVCFTLVLHPRHCRHILKLLRVSYTVSLLSLTVHYSNSVMGCFSGY